MAERFERNRREEIQLEEQLSETVRRSEELERELQRLIAEQGRNCRDTVRP